MKEDIVDTMWSGSTGNTYIIKVIGVGGGGCNAVNHMYKLGIKDVGFVVCNTDMQALNSSPVPVKVQLGKKITEGLGAGSQPEQGRMAAEESRNEIAELMQGNTKMVFITAGMGGGTGTGAAPVIAKIAKDMGMLTVAIVTIPFISMEPLRIETAHSGIRELRKYVDSLLVIKNEKILDLYSDLTFFEAFAKADEVLCTAAKSIAEIITISGHMNVDFADVRTAMKDSGVALIGIGRCSGENRAEEAVNQAISSPLLNDNNIRGAKNVLVNIMMGEKELKVIEVKRITEIVLGEVGGVTGTTGNTAKPYIKTGVGKNPQLGEDVTVSIIATGFEMGDIGITENGDRQRPNRQKPAPSYPTQDEIWGDAVENVDRREENFVSGHGYDAQTAQWGAEVVTVKSPATVGRQPHLLNKEIPDGELDLPIRLPHKTRGSHAAMQGSGIPYLLNREISDEELDRPIRSPKKTKANRSEGEVSGLLFSTSSNKWESTSASYINGNPD
ncbi:MAG: cell division protein FtsZ [Prevotellaceae bacterium]|jgi:cell division protein FtsZ|nr:cell division protein FtsZ [Prevotellaceae bacterium]